MLKKLNTVVTEANPQVEIALKSGKEFYTLDPQGLYGHRIVDKDGKETVNETLTGDTRVSVPTPKTSVPVTDMQIDLLRGYLKSEFHSTSSTDKLSDGVWTFSVMDNAGVDAQLASGSLASLKMKGVITMTLPGKGDHGNTSVYLTEVGKTVVAELGLLAE